MSDAAAELSKHHEQQAEEYLQRGHRHGDPDAATFFATVANTHATLAVLYQLRSTT